MSQSIEKLADLIYADVLPTVDKKYLLQAKSFTNWIKTLKDLRKEESYINADKTERLAMAKVLGFRPNHLMLASNSDENIAKRALKDAEIRLSKLKANIKKILTDLNAVSFTRIPDKSSNSVLKFSITSEQGTKHLFRVVTSATARSRYSNVVRTALDVTTLD